MRRVNYLGVALLAIASLLSGCKSDTRSTAFETRHAEEMKHFLLKGKVVSVDAEMGKVTIAHGDIPNYMPAMTMAFPVQDTTQIATIERGDQVEADLVVGDNTSYLQSIDVIQHASGDHASAIASSAHYPRVGEAAHEFHLITQDGKPISLSDYKGEPLLVTFIYSRCPLPQFCPLLNVKFAEMAHALHDHENEYPPAKLLSVTIDPEHDTVPVLKDFSTHFDAIQCGNWNYATGTAKQVRAFASNMGLDYWQESGQVVHSVVTVLIDKNLKIAKIWNGNDWTTSEVLDAIKQTGKS